MAFCTNVSHLPDLVLLVAPAPDLYKPKLCCSPLCSAARQIAREASAKDDQVDDNKDGIADVKQINAQQVRLASACRGVKG